MKKKSIPLTMDDLKNLIMAYKTARNSANTLKDTLEGLTGTDGLTRFCNHRIEKKDEHCMESIALCGLRKNKKIPCHNPWPLEHYECRVDECPLED